MSDEDSNEELNDESTENNPTFNIGDYRSFIYMSFSHILTLIVVLSVGIHVLYTLKNNYEDFVNDAFPTNENESPFCKTSDQCDRSIFYRDTVINGKPYEPKFMFNCKKHKDDNNNTTYNCDKDMEYVKWYLYWINNSFIKMNIFNNKIYKYIYNFIHNNVDPQKFGMIDSFIVFFGGFIGITFITFFMIFITKFWSIHYGELYAYQNEAWVLKLPVFGSLYLIFRNMIPRFNIVNILLSIFCLMFSWVWWIIKICIFMLAICLPIVKVLRTHLIPAFFIYWIIKIRILLWFIRFLTGKIEFSTRYDDMISYLSYFKRGIMFWVSIIILYFAYTYLTTGIAIGMTICGVYLLYVNRHTNK
jgi:hypothetical protein